MRLFVAVFPPPEVRRETLRSARGHVPDDRIRWSKPENVHLTLKFLGDTRREALDDLRTILEDVRERHSPFEVGLSGLGAFPSARRARVVWAGVDAGSDRLRSLASDIDAALASLPGVEREDRPYEPHLTLARTRGRPVALDFSTNTHDTASFEVYRFELVESTLNDNGATYRAIEAFTLEGEG